MDSELEVKNTFCIVRLKGCFRTGSDSDYLRTVGELDELGTRTVVLDCSELERLDSTGLSFLVGLHNKVLASAGRFALVNNNPRVREILQITHLDRVLSVYDTVGAAADSL